MPSEFDSLFRDEATPALMSVFGESITFKTRITSVKGEYQYYSPTATVGREEIKRVRTKDGYKVLRVREILVSLDATDGVTPLPEDALMTLQEATVGGHVYKVMAFDRAPGRQARITLERSDASEISRPNLRERR